MIRRRGDADDDEGDDELVSARRMTRSETVASRRQHCRGDPVPHMQHQLRLATVSNPPNKSIHQSMEWMDGWNACMHECMKERK